MYRLRFVGDELIEWDYAPGHRHENSANTKEQALTLFLFQILFFEHIETKDKNRDK